MKFKNKLFLAPMVGVNNIAFRKLCSGLGADIVYSQMIDSRAFGYGNRKLADFKYEKNIIAQFLGNDADIVAKCAKDVEDKVQAVDLNLGCPHSSVVDRKCGAYLMKYPRTIEKIINKIIKSINIPVTVKMRAGFDRKHINAVKIAKICEKEGVSAIIVHGRPRTVNYEHPVDYNIIKKVKEAVNIPVIGNGDIFSNKDAERMIEKTGCDSVMMGRGAIGNPAIFQEIKGKKAANKKQIGVKYFKLCRKYRIDFKDVKTHVQWFTKGLDGGAHYRNLMNTAKSAGDLEKIYESIEWI